MPPQKLHISRVCPALMPISELDPVDPQDEIPETTSLLRNRRDPSHMDVKATNVRGNQSVLLETTKSKDGNDDERAKSNSMEVSLCLCVCVCVKLESICQVTVMEERKFVRFTNLLGVFIAGRRGRQRAIVGACPGIILEHKLNSFISCTCGPFDI